MLYEEFWSILPNQKYDLHEYRPFVTTTVPTTNYVGSELYFNRISVWQLGNQIYEMFHCPKTIYLHRISFILLNVCRCKINLIDWVTSQLLQM